MGHEFNSLVLFTLLINPRRSLQNQGYFSLDQKEEEEEEKKKKKSFKFDGYFEGYTCSFRSVHTTLKRRDLDVQLRMCVKFTELAYTSKRHIVFKIWRNYP